MKKKVVLFALVLSLTILNACASEQAAYVNGTGSGKAAVPDTSALPVQAAEATGMAHADETAEKTGSSDAVPSDMKAVLLDKVINTDASYSAYDADIFGADYIGDGKTEYFIVFTEKGSKKEAAIGCSADIWFGDESGVKRVAEWQCIEPDTYGSLTLAGKYYFRYDLAFVTERTSVTCEFLKRCNGLIHININCETKDDITHYYRTCKITGDNTLETDETAEGSYMTAISDKAVYK